jgi:hypothetical protein
VECAIELDADFVSNCTISELGVLQCDESEVFQFEIPHALLAGGTDEVIKHPSTTGFF